jgi:SAM-dependent methyltransferase
MMLASLTTEARFNHEKKTMTNPSAFDGQATEYDTWFDKHNDLYRAELEAVRSLVPIAGKGVEIGVGTGRFALPLGISLGVEPAREMAEMARRRGMDVREGVAEALPFGDNGFDYAVMVTVVCFLDDVAKAFHEAWRILKSGGVLVIGFIDRESELGRIYEQKKERSVFYRSATFYSVSDLTALLRQAGFAEFAYRQTLFPDGPAALTVREGFGDGGFVAIGAHKNRKGYV